METRLGLWTGGVLALTMLAAPPVIARQVSKAGMLACGGTGPQQGTITVTEKDAVLKIKVKGQGLAPGQSATCGYTCGMVFASGPEVFCGTVNDNGKLSGTIELPLATCFGFIPFFNTPTTGKCVGSTVP
jgi:hypothetical protein